MDNIRRSVSRAFENIDLIITPTVRIPPFTIVELQGNVDDVRAKELGMLHNTRPINLTGLPTISVPCGSTRGGLPIGMQITGRAGEETTVLRLAYAYEQATEWHKREPAFD